MNRQTVFVVMICVFIVTVIAYLKPDWVLEDWMLKDNIEQIKYTDNPHPQIVYIGIIVSEPEPIDETKNWFWIEVKPVKLKGKTVYVVVSHRDIDNPDKIASRTFGKGKKIKFSWINPDIPENDYGSYTNSYTNGLWLYIQ